MQDHSIIAHGTAGDLAWDLVSQLNPEEVKRLARGAATATATAASAASATAVPDPSDIAKIQKAIDKHKGQNTVELARLFEEYKKGALGVKDTIDTIITKLEAEVENAASSVSARRTSTRRNIRKDRKGRRSRTSRQSRS